MGGRAPSHLREQYERHLRECRDCRRVHRLLNAIYENPFETSQPSDKDADREFRAILRRSREEAQPTWYKGLSVKASIGGLSAAAAVLALALFDLAPNPLPRSLSAPPAAPGDATSMPVVASSSGGVPPTIDEQGGIDHPAQSYGRVVGGGGLVLDDDDEPINSSTFPVGTSFRVGLHESLQVALAGKIVANFTPGSEVHWDTASPSLLQMNMSRGLIAMRYDRKPSDPVLQLLTPTALVRVVGTVFTVQVDSDRNTVVSVLRGEVEVLDPANKRLLAEVEAGYRFDVSNSTVSDVGKIEVGAALPLSNERTAGHDPADPGALADGAIPTDWNVPGLPSGHRTLAYVPTLDSPEIGAVDTLRVAPTSSASRNGDAQAATTARIERVSDDDGEDLIEHLMRDAKATRRKEVRGTLERCRGLYETDRYRAAECLAHFLGKYGHDPLAVEGYLLVGILRMDYALDYRAADTAFEEFLRRAPHHPRAELALYRLWLSATEDGRIREGLTRGREYLSRYPQGRHVGKILQRFPELKSAL